MKTLSFFVLIITYFNCYAQTARTNPMMTFPRLSLEDVPKQISWTVILEDGKSDEARPGIADGKRLSYFYDTETDLIWFKIEVYGEVDSLPAISISIDTDANQQTGINWYGNNESFTFEKMISVGPIRINDEGYYGFNGITDQEGVKNRDWINYKKGVVNFYTIEPNKTFVISVSRKDIDPGLQKINLIGSVGALARWNDDIGDSGYATIILKE